MDFLGSLASGVSEVGQIASAAAAAKNAYSASTESDDAKRLEINKRLFCTKKMAWVQAKDTFLWIVLPILIIIIIVLIPVSESIREQLKKAYPLLALWIVVGAILQVWRNAVGYNKRIFDINTAKQLNIETCKPIKQ